MQALEIQAMTAANAAKELQVTVAMVYRWLGDHKLEEVYLSGGGPRLVSVASVERLKAERGQAA